MKINRLADLEIYVQGLKLTHECFELTRNKILAREFSLIDQLKRASISVAANIAEGYGRKTKKDFSQFLSIALGSVNEIQCYLDFINLEFEIETKILNEKYEILAKRIYSFRSYLLSQNS